MRPLFQIGAAGLLLLGGLMAAVRLAPADAARWHRAPSASDTLSDGPCADSIRTGPNTAEAHCLHPGTATALLARLDAIATATPRTTRVAGSPEDGLVTWETRSRMWGFPDYTTAAATDTDRGARLDILARSRFGQSDLGVNAARLRDWLARL